MYVYITIRPDFKGIEIWIKNYWLEAIDELITIRPDFKGIEIHIKSGSISSSMITIRPDFKGIEIYY